VQGVVVVGQHLAERAQAGRHHLEDAAGGVLRHFLGHARHHRARAQADLAVVGVDVAGDQLHQGGLAGAVAADDAHPLAGVDGQLDLLEQQRAADAVVDALELQ
jgi:hypothetical protein